MKKEIDAFFADLDVQRLLQLSTRSQALQICFPREVNVSRMLAWLLDPSEGHGLGDMALRSLLTRAGQMAEGNNEIPLPIHRFLRPSSIFTTGFSGAIVTTEVKVGVQAGAMDSLDIFCVDQVAGVYIAIENKFGAKESPGQLRKYRLGLEKLFPGMRGVHIFMDSSSEPPKDPVWIAVGYDWLTEFLREVEQRRAIAPEVRSTLAEFRQAVQEEESDAASSAIERLQTQVATRHAAVLRQMASMAGAKGAMARELQTRMAASKGKDKALGEAQLRLFLLFWQRPHVWERCLKLVDFAPFLDRLRTKHPDLLVDQKRVNTYVSLPEWKRFVEPDEHGEWSYPLVVSISAKADRYTVAAYCWFGHVRTDQRDELLKRAKKLRQGHLADNGMEAPTFLAVRRQLDLRLADAVEAAQQQLAVLQAGFRDIG